MELRIALRGYEMWLKRIKGALRAGLQGAREAWDGGPQESQGQSQSTVGENDLTADIGDIEFTPSEDNDLMCRCQGENAPETIDPCILDLVDCLNRHGIRTWGSCCGHGAHKGTILIAKSCLTEHGGGLINLRPSKKPILVPFHFKSGQWVDDNDNPGYSTNWYARRPYSSKG